MYTFELILVSDCKSVRYMEGSQYETNVWFHESFDDHHTHPCPLFQTNLYRFYNSRDEAIEAFKKVKQSFLKEDENRKAIKEIRGRWLLAQHIATDVI